MSRIGTALVMALALLIVACTSDRPAPTEANATYAMQGTVVRLRSEGANIAVIKHGEIKGWMEPMTMEFPVPKQEEFQKLREGQQITATVFVKDLEYWIDDIRVIAGTNAGQRQ